MKKLILVSSLLAATSFAQLSQAESGTIMFTGSLSSASCSLSNAGNISMPLGQVPFEDVKAIGDTGIIAHAEENMVVTCSNATGLTSVHAKLAPILDDNQAKLLKTTTGEGKGAGIALLNDAGAIIDLSTPAGQTLTTAMIVDGDDGTATFALKAAYIQNGEELVAGDAGAALPFELSYE